MFVSNFAALLAALGAFGLIATVILGKAATPVLLDVALLCLVAAAIIYCGHFFVHLWRDSHHA